MQKLDACSSTDTNYFLNLGRDLKTDEKILLGKSLINIWERCLLFFVRTFIGEAKANHYLQNKAIRYIRRANADLITQVAPTMQADIKRKVAKMSYFASPAEIQVVNRLFDPQLAQQIHNSSFATTWSAELAHLQQTPLNHGNSECLKNLELRLQIDISLRELLAKNLLTDGDIPMLYRLLIWQADAELATTPLSALYRAADQLENLHQQPLATALRGQTIETYFGETLPLTYLYEASEKLSQTCFPARDMLKAYVTYYATNRRTPISTNWHWFKTTAICIPRLLDQCQKEYVGLLPEERIERIIDGVFTDLVDHLTDCPLPLDLAALTQKLNFQLQTALKEPLTKQLESSFSKFPLAEFKAQEVVHGKNLHGLAVLLNHYHRMAPKATKLELLAAIEPTEGVTERAIRTLDKAIMQGIVNRDWHQLQSGALAKELPELAKHIPALNLQDMHVPLEQRRVLWAQFIANLHQLEMTVIEQENALKEPAAKEGLTVQQLRQHLKRCIILAVAGGPAGMAGLEASFCQALQQHSARRIDLPVLLTRIQEQPAVAVDLSLALCRAYSRHELSEEQKQYIHMHQDVIARQIEHLRSAIPIERLQAVERIFSIAPDKMMPLLQEIIGNFIQDAELAEKNPHDTHNFFIQHFSQLPLDDILPSKAAMLFSGPALWMGTAFVGYFPGWTTQLILHALSYQLYPHAHTLVSMPLPSDFSEQEIFLKISIDQLNGYLPATERFALDGTQSLADLLQMQKAALAAIDKKRAALRVALQPLILPIMQKLIKDEHVEHLRNHFKAIIEAVQTDGGKEAIYSKMAGLSAYLLRQMQQDQEFLERVLIELAEASAD